MMAIQPFASLHSISSQYPLISSVAASPLFPTSCIQCLGDVRVFGPPPHASIS
jgi:hypothetical protein